MTAQAILEELKPLGKDSYKKVMLNHGVREPFFGVNIQHLQTIRKYPVLPVDLAEGDPTCRHLKS